jgi:hypothetical protein
MITIVLINFWTNLGRFLVSSRHGIAFPAQASVGQGVA